MTARSWAFVGVVAFFTLVSLASRAAGQGDAEVQARLRSCTAALVRSAADEVLRDPATLREPLMLFFAAAGRRTVGDKDEASFLYLAARLRSSRQLVFEKGDRPQLAAVIGGSIGTQILPTIEADPEFARRVVKRVIDWDRATPDPYRDRQSDKVIDTEKKLAEIDASLARLPEQIASDPARIARAQRTDRQTDTRIAAERAKRCVPGRLDSADVELAKSRIDESATRLVRSHPLVLKRAQGAIVSTSVGARTSSADGDLPRRLTISVQPKAGKRFYAEVDVRTTISAQRKLTAIDTSLACITELWIGQREAQWKDVCTDDPNALRSD